jgi:hypothetical protein
MNHRRRQQNPPKAANIAVVWQIGGGDSTGIVGSEYIEVESCRRLSPRIGVQHGESAAVVVETDGGVDHADRGRVPRTAD